MPAPLVGALLAIALAAPPEQTLVASALPPAVVMSALPAPAAPSVLLNALPPTAPSVLLNALPPPPSKVVRETRTYGTVTLDHAAHLARKLSCKACHGEGPVSKIPRMQPRQAHDLCRKCHVELARGPTDCRGCHVVAPTSQTAVAAAPLATPGSPAGGAGPAAAVAPPAAPAAAPASPASAPRSGGALPPPPPPPPVGAPVGVGTLASADAPVTVTGELPVGRFPGGFLEEEEGLPVFHRVLEAGFAMRTGPEGARFGPSAKLITRQGRAVMVHNVEWSGGTGGRTLLLIGGGAAIPLDDRVAFLVVGMGGADAIGGREVVILPAAGASVGLQWVRAVPWLDSLGVTVSGVSDLLRHRTAFGDRVGGLTFGLSIAAGYRMSR